MAPGNLTLKELARAMNDPGADDESDFWDTDIPGTVDEALALMRFGCVNCGEPNSEDIARFERRVQNCANFFEKHLRDLSE